MRKILILLFIHFSILGLMAQKKSNTEKYIIDLSKKKFAYMQPDSLSKLKSVLDDRMVYIHSSGMIEDKQSMVDNIAAGKWMIKKVDIKKPVVRVFKSSMAILTAEGKFYLKSTGNTDLTMDLYYTEVWAKYKEGWKLISRHASKLN